MRRYTHNPYAGLPAGAQVSAEWARGGRTVRPGDEVSVRGARGRYRFRQHVRLADGREWVDLVREDGFRSVRPDAVRVVHRARKLRAARPADGPREPRTVVAA